VEWVHQNIANFGGDASKVTIFGQSSGGVAADWWTYAYKDEPLVNGIIMESGNAFSFPNEPTRTASEQLAKRICHSWL
jgi:cholinesterase